MPMEKEVKIIVVTVCRKDYEQLILTAFLPGHCSLTYKVLNKHCYFTDIFMNIFWKDDGLSVPCRRKCSPQLEYRKEPLSLAKVTDSYFWAPLPTTVER